MAVAFDGVTAVAATSTSPASGTHTPTPDNAPTLALIWIFDNFTTAPTTGTVTYGGTACSLVTGSAVTDPSFGQDRIQLYALVSSVPTGAQTASAAWSGGSGNTRRLWVETYTGTDANSLSNNAQTASGSGTSDNPSVGATNSASGDMASDAVTAVILPSDATFTVGAGQTQRWNSVPGANQAFLGSTEPGAAGTVTMSWTNNGAPLSLFSWAASTVNIKQAATAGDTGEWQFRQSRFSGPLTSMVGYNL